MATRQLEPQVGVLSYLLNIGLLALAGAAWAAAQFPTHAAAITFATAGVALALSAGCAFLARNWRVEAKEVHAGEGKATETEQIDLIRADETDSLSTPAILQKIRASSLEGSQQTLRLLAEWMAAERQSRKQQLYIFDRELRRNHLFHHQYPHTNPFFDPKQVESENYEVKVGMVTVRVSKGNAEIKIDSKNDRDKSKVDMVLAPEANYSDIISDKPH